jgi:hypothetical protein
LRRYPCLGGRLGLGRTADVLAIEGDPRREMGRRQPRVEAVADGQVGDGRSFRGCPGDDRAVGSGRTPARLPSEDPPSRSGRHREERVAREPSSSIPAVSPSKSAADWASVSQRTPPRPRRRSA